MATFQMFDEDDMEVMQMKNFKQMIGFIGDSFVGERLFHVMKQSYKTMHEANLIAIRSENHSRNLLESVSPTEVPGTTPIK